MFQLRVACYILQFLWAQVGAARGYQLATHKSWWKSCQLTSVFLSFISFCFEQSFRMSLRFMSPTYSTSGGKGPITHYPGRICERPPIPKWFLVQKRKTTPILPPAWIMVLLHFQVGLSLCIPKWTLQELKGPPKTSASFRRWRPCTDADKPAGSYPPQGETPRLPHGWLQISNSPRYLQYGP